jgi:replicative DNA helicase
MNKQKSASNPGNPFDRALPNNPAAEKSVIGALIRDPAKIGVIQGSIGLEASDFYTPNHQIIFQTILDLFSEKLPIDLMLLAERLEKNDSLEKVGGAYYLMDVANSSATSANAEYYAAIVKEKSLRRLLLRDNWDIAQNAHNEDLDLLTLRIQELSKKVTNPLGRSQRPILLGDCFEKVISDTQEALERLDQKGVLRKYATGLIALDRIMGGFNPGQMVITAARPSEGKSALLCTFMSYAAAHYGPALLFPLEMTVEEMAARYL